MGTRGKSHVNNHPTIAHTQSHSISPPPLSLSHLLLLFSFATLSSCRHTHRLHHLAPRLPKPRALNFVMANSKKKKKKKAQRSVGKWIHLIKQSFPLLYLVMITQNFHWYDIFTGGRTGKKNAFPSVHLRHV